MHEYQLQKTVWRPSFVSAAYAWENARCASGRKSFRHAPVRFGRFAFFSVPSWHFTQFRSRIGCTSRGKLKPAVGASGLTSTGPFTPR